jgi:hypothetical protein
VISYLITFLLLQIQLVLKVKADVLLHQELLRLQSSLILVVLVNFTRLFLACTLEQ